MRMLVIAISWLVAATIFFGLYFQLEKINQQLSYIDENMQSMGDRFDRLTSIDHCKMVCQFTISDENDRKEND